VAAARLEAITAAAAHIGAQSPLAATFLFREEKDTNDPSFIAARDIVSPFQRNFC